MLKAINFGALSLDTRSAWSAEIWCSRKMKWRWGRKELRTWNKLHLIQRRRRLLSGKYHKPLRGLNKTYLKRFRSKGNPLSLLKIWRSQHNIIWSEAGPRDNKLSSYIHHVTAISWRSSLQVVVALSTTEAEFISFTKAVKESLWIKGFLRELGIEQNMWKIYCDSQSAIHLVRNQVTHERTKDVDVKLHFIKQNI